MKIAMIGTGYVGLVSGVCFSDFGHEVVCVDKMPEKISMLEMTEEQRAILENVHVEDIPYFAKLDSDLKARRS